jgi:hypothetical protein
MCPSRLSGSVLNCYCRAMMLGSAPSVVSINIVVAVTALCGSSQNCGRSHHQRQYETFDGHAFKSNRRQECVRVPGKRPDQSSNAIRDAWNAGSRPPPRVWASRPPENRYHSSQLGDHPGNPGSFRRLLFVVTRHKGLDSRRLVTFNVPFWA